MRYWLGFVACAALMASAPSFAQDAPAETTAETPAPAISTDTTPVAAPTQPAAATSAEDAERAAFEAQARTFYESLDRRTGAISLVGGKVSLNVPESHYYLSPADSRRVIVDVWGNPPSAGEHIEGMVFPAGANPMTSAWGAVLEYLADGHVDDSDAQTINYDELLGQLQQQAEQINPERVRQGYPELFIDSWAEPPHYEQSTHTLYWAKLLRISDGSGSLNYDIRVLGREGVFVVSFIAAPTDIAAIRAEAPAVMQMPTFTRGNTYADFQPGVDQSAAYGIGGLIAGGALAAVAQKTGLLALILAFGKKFIVLIIAGAAGLFGMIGRMFKKKQPDDDGLPPPHDPPPP